MGNYTIKLTPSLLSHPMLTYVVVPQAVLLKSPLQWAMLENSTRSGLNWEMAASVALSSKTSPLMLLWCGFYLFYFFLMMQNSSGYSYYAFQGQWSESDWEPDGEKGKVWLHPVRNNWPCWSRYYTFCIIIKKKNNSNLYIWFFL